MKMTCKWFNDVKGFGFMTETGNKDSPEYFLHYSKIESFGFKTVSEGKIYDCDVDSEKKAILVLRKD